MAFKSYCWCIGTTSFRVTQLNFKNESHLRFLSELFSNNQDISWEGNSELQIKYYELMKSKNFIKGDATRKDKDAREKTSGLVDIGLVEKNRMITPVGDLINKISLSMDYSSDNVLDINKDSYVYLLQFLKLQIVDDVNEIKIKPFLSLVYMLCKLEYLSRDEFTYLLPICKNLSDVLNMVATLKISRGKINTDKIIIDKMLSLDNYKEAYKIFIESEDITEKTMIKVGMHRKSPEKYDTPFANVYNILKEIVLNKNQLNNNSKIVLIKKLQEAIDLVNENQNTAWKQEFKFNRSPKINDDFVKKFYENIFCYANNENEFKEIFFKFWHLNKWKLTLEDYYDLNKRYFDLTEIIKYQNEQFKLSELAKIYFADIIDKIIIAPFMSENKYNQFFTSVIRIDNIYAECNKTKDDIAKIIHKVHGVKVSPSELENYYKELKNKEFIELIDNKFPKNVLLELMDCFKNRHDKRIAELISENAKTPTAFEYVMGIIWYNLSEREGYLLDYMRLSLDSNLLPITHAIGGNADLIFNYQKTNNYVPHTLLLEVTLSESTSQTQMEWGSVSNHLESSLRKTHNANNYAVFVANNLEERTIKHFRLLKDYEVEHDGREIGKLKIIPLDVNDIKSIIMKDIKYTALYSIFDDSFKSLQLSNQWYINTINQKI